MTMPTIKSKSIEDLITNMAGISRQDASKQKICSWCKRPVISFHDPLSAKEYRISGMCQKCQDEVFDCEED